MVSQSKSGTATPHEEAKLSFSKSLARIENATISYVESHIKSQAWFVKKKVSDDLLLKKYRLFPLTFSGVFYVRGFSKLFLEEG